MSDHMQALYRTLLPFAVAVPAAVLIALVIYNVPPMIIALLMTVGVAGYLSVMLYRDNLNTVRREREQNKS